MIDFLLFHDFNREETKKENNIKWEEDTSRRGVNIWRYELGTVYSHFQKVVVSNLNLEGKRNPNSAFFGI